ncbi:MAG: DUF1667 domain-containing protein [Clostridiaceae bacterium]|nr:DUF1667 domain-containing protein [Clostridiaceae bacterium]
MEVKDMVCIVCPLGCKLQVKPANDRATEFMVEGNKCPRGAEYGVKELTNPTRVITSTVRIKNAHLNRIPVKTNGAIPKGLMEECMRKLNFVEVKSPVKVGDVIIKDVLGTGIDIVATRSM